jgi:hypothetical protein
MQMAFAEILTDGTDEEQKIAKATLRATAVAFFENSNIGAVDNQGQPPTFTITQAHLVVNIWTYHWNGGRGATPGRISLKRSEGATYGPWDVTATSGQGGAPNVNWECNPNITIPAGTYTVIDSDAATWSQNVMSKGFGFSRVRGIPID